MVEKQNPVAKDDSLDGTFTRFLVFCLACSVIGGGLQVGWAIGVYNTPVEIMKSFYRDVGISRNVTMTNDDVDRLWDITNGLMPLGAIVGSLMSSFIVNYFGRKNGILLANVFVVTSGVYNVISKWSMSYETLILSRFICGIYCGLFTSILPLYLNELPPKNLSGSCGVLVQFSIVVGILIANICGLNWILGTADRWPVLVGLMFLPVLAHVALLVWGVESPKHLYINLGHVDEAKKVLIKLRGADKMALVEKELEDLRLEKEASAKQKKISLIEFTRQKHLRRPLIIAVGTQLSMQFSGINAISYYSTELFKSVGLTGDMPLYGTILLSLVMVLMTFCSMSLVEKAGRKVLLLGGLVGMAVFSFGLVLAGACGGPGREWLNYATIVCAVMYSVFFSIGPGSIPWILSSEMFQSDARTQANSMAVFTNWFGSFVVTLTFSAMNKALGKLSFLVFGFLLVFFSLFVLVCMPETKNKSTEQIIEMFNKRWCFLFDSDKNNNKVSDEKTIENGAEVVKMKELEL